MKILYDDTVDVYYAVCAVKGKFKQSFNFGLDKRKDAITFARDLKKVGYEVRVDYFVERKTVKSEILYR